MKSKMIHNLIIYHFFSCPSPNRFGDDVIIKVFHCGSAGKESACDAGDLGSIPGLGRSPGEGSGNPIQCSCLENPIDRGAWWATVHGVAKSWKELKQLSMHACEIKRFKEREPGCKHSRCQDEGVPHLSSE